MMQKTWLLLIALAVAAGCATEAPKPEAQKPAAAPAPAPTPAPRAVEAPKPKPVAEKVTFSTDVLFDFDRAVIKPEGQQKLDELQGRMRGVSVEVVIAIGHADRLGGDAYNQRLSVRRADAVKAYLTSKGTEQNRVYTEGKGKKQPVSGDKCKAMGNDRKNAKLIECLQPDRRVEIEVIGTRAP
jgi:OmpA-OmpF porin, OOP family